MRAKVHARQSSRGRGRRWGMCEGDFRRHGSFFVGVCVCVCVWLCVCVCMALEGRLAREARPMLGFSVFFSCIFL